MTAPKFLSFSPAPLSYSDQNTGAETRLLVMVMGRGTKMVVLGEYLTLADQKWMVTVTIVSTLLSLSQVARH